MYQYLIYLTAYLIGCFPTAVIICRLKGLPDPRKQGSKNPGATNVLRMGDKSAAAWVAVGDVLKGVLPVLIARWLGFEDLTLAIVALAVVVGHMFPVFFKFKGGKGIATAFGAFLALSWPVALLLGLTWVSVLYFSRFSSLAGISSAVAAPIYFYLFSNPHYLPAVLFISVLIVIRHHKNIKQLLVGKEDKVDR